MPDSIGTESSVNAHEERQNVDFIEQSYGLGRMFQLTKALLWRGLHEQGARLVLVPVLCTCFILVVSFVAFYFPGILTSATRYGVEQQAKLYFSATNNNAGLAMALLLIQGPYLIALFAAFTGASLAQNIVGTEAARGGLELLLGTVYKVEDIFVSFLFTAFVFTIVGWFILALGTLGLAAAVLVLLRIHFNLPVSYFALATAIPLPIALWANLSTLFLTMKFPRLVQIRTGSTTNLLQLLAMLPSIILLILMNIRPDLNLGVVAAVALVLGVIGSVASTVLLRHHFQPEFLLES